MGSAVAHTGPLRTGSRRTEGRLPLIACGTAGLSLEQAGARAWSELHLYDWFGKGCAQRSSQCRSPPPHMRISTHLHHFSVRLHELSSHDLRHCKSLSQWRHVSKFAQKRPKVNVHAGHLRKFPLFLYVFLEICRLGMQPGKSLICQWRATASSVWSQAQSPGHRPITPRIHRVPKSR